MLFGRTPAMTRRRHKRLLLGIGIAAALLLSPVFWLLPYRKVSLGNVFVLTMPFPQWTLGTWDEPEFVYSGHDPLAFKRRKVYMTQTICCGAFVVRIRGREVPDMWEQPR
jgi:hypothetical protein